MSFLDVAKNQVTSQIAGRVNRAVHGGLKRVSGNLPGSSIGKGSNSNPNSAAMQQKTRFTTKNITYPINVEGDPMQGHFIMFMINQSNKAVLKADKNTTFKSVAKRLKQEAQTTGDDAYSQNIVSTNLVNNLIPQVGRQGRGSPTTSLALKMHATTRLDTAISLYMPPSVSVQYGIKYADEGVGVLAETGYNAINEMMLKRELSIESFTSALPGLKSGALQYGKEAALKKLPDFGPQGATTLIALHRGAIITPRMELMIEGVGRRSFMYTFDFIPKSVQESKIVDDIIYAFKFHMHPEYVQDAAAFAGKEASKAAGKFAISGVGREMSIPSTFDIAYMYQTDRNSFLNKISTCFLKSMDVQYGAERFTAYESTEGNFGSGAPPQRTQITLNFGELEIITKERIQEGY